jgi:hypothetical protein
MLNEINISKKSLEEFRIKLGQCKNEIENKNEEWNIKEKQLTHQIVSLNKNKNSIDLNKDSDNINQARVIIYFLLILEN